MSDDRHPRAKILNRAQIFEITDLTTLYNMLDDVTDNIIAIETNLEYSNGDDEWRRSAIGAMIHIKIARKNLKARLEMLNTEKRQKPKKITLISALEYLYDHEINCAISSFWDAGFTVSLGDSTNGFKTAVNFEAVEIDSAGAWLIEEAKKAYPKCEWKNDGHHHGKENT